jgi:hypothetical protein
MNVNMIYIGFSQYYSNDLYSESHVACIVSGMFVSGVPQELQCVARLVCGIHSDRCEVLRYQGASRVY